MQNIIEYLEDRCLHSPHRTAFVFLENGDETEKRISYRELESGVKQVVCMLRNMNLEGEKVLLVYQDAREFITTFLACQYCGLIPVPVSYFKGSKQVARLMHIFNDAKAAAVLCTNASITPLQNGLSGLAGSGEIKIIPTNATPSSDTAQWPHNPSYSPISFIQYTSGSTGHPKGVIVSAENLLHNQQLIRNVFCCDENSVILSWLPFHHDMGLIGNILHTLYIGCTCILMSPFHFMQSPRRWLEAISRYKATHSGGPNFAYDLCVDKISRDELPALDLSGWTVAFNGSEPIRSETIERFSSYFKLAGFRSASFYPCYGLAEATLLVAGDKKEPIPATIFIKRNLISGGKIILSDKSDLQSQGIVSSGSIASGIECRIISPDNQMNCGELEEGEICISGNSVTKGYLNRDNSDLFYEFDGQPFLRTGDLGFLYGGELFVHGRIKEMLIVRGKNIYPYDIEEGIFENEQAIETNGVAVFGLNEMEEQLVIIAEIKRTFLKELDAENMIRSIDKKVTGSFGISPFDIVLTTPLGIPRTTSGKLQRLKCKEYYQTNSFTVIGSKERLSKKQVKKEKNHLLLSKVISLRDYNSINEYLVDLIECKIGELPLKLRDQNTELTELGIDSLRIMELINTVNRDLAINMDATRIVQDSTLAGLAGSIENLLWLKSTQSFGKEIEI